MNEEATASTHSLPRIVLVDPDHGSREVMVRRLRAQGYAVEATADGAAGATMALGAPPAAVVTDLWMPSISGIQLCRLLRAEPATADVPVILRGDVDDPRSRFWAERAGAAAYIAKGRMAELTRALATAVAERPDDHGFFLQLSDGTLDIRDRIAKQLDTALFESVIAGEVRALGQFGSFEQLFDHFSQLFSQLVRYRWLALRTLQHERVAVHHHPGDLAGAEREARHAFSVDEDVPVLRVVDEDARHEPVGTAPVVLPITMGSTVLGHIALSPTSASADSSDTMQLLELVSRELAGPLRIAELVEAAERLATTDALTGLVNRRAFSAGFKPELARSGRYGLPLSVLVLDIDHFKLINDQHGHSAGDLALIEAANAIRATMREADVLCRWGGEEFVILLTNTNLAGAEIAAERLRERIAGIRVQLSEGTLAMTASIGVTDLRRGDGLERLIERADAAMYRAKAGGRNRVVVDHPTEELAVAPSTPSAAHN